MSTGQSHARWSAAAGDASRPDAGRLSEVTQADANQRPRRSDALDTRILEMEHKMPDGAGTSAHESAALPWIIAGLAVFGVVGIFVLLTWTDNWQAGLLGAGWVMGGYCVAWIVVWGAGLARAGDERTIERSLQIDDGSSVHSEHKKSA